MLQRLNPATVRAVPDTFACIYTHSCWIERPTKIVALSGQIGVTMDGTTPAEFRAQCHQAMDHVEALLAAHDLLASDILKITYYLTRSEDLPELTEIRQTRWHSNTPPAITTLVVAGLASPDLLVEIEVLAAK